MTTDYQNTLDLVQDYLDDVVTLPFDLELPPHDPTRYSTLCGFDDDSCDTNGQRAEYARRLVPSEDDSAVADAIGNLLHLAHARGEDPMDVVRRGLRDFLMEAGSRKEAP